MPPESATWLLLITNLPGHKPKLRMRLWRALKAAGAELLRDGVYLLPNSVTARRAFSEQVREIHSGGGMAHLLHVRADSPAQGESFRALFDRTGDYAKAAARLTAFKREFGKLSEPEAQQRLAALRREVSALIGRDFFPGKPREQMEEALQDAQTLLDARFAPDEPGASDRKITRRRAREYRGRTWATRERLWIDRVASAWLIRRFIDRKAKFLWLERIEGCPNSAIGFDFDGAEFTHVGTRVTFEVLLASFGLELDPGLARLGALVHYLDVGGIPVAEAPGVASIMAGARALQPNDDGALLSVMTTTFDALYAAYSKSPPA